MASLPSRATVILAFAAGCGAQQGSSTTTAAESPPREAATETVTDGLFQSVMPPGFVRQDIQDAIALVRTERSPTPDSLLGSIVVVPVRYDSPEQRSNAADPAVCRAEAELFARQLRDGHGVSPEPVRQEVLSLPSGPVCQFELRVSGATVRPHIVVLTILQSDVRDHTVTCSVAAGDEVGRSGCESFLQSWSWADPI